MSVRSSDHFNLDRFLILLKYQTRRSKTTEFEGNRLSSTHIRTSMKGNQPTLPATVRSSPKAAQLLRERSLMWQ